jgi:hypothetical protein
MKKIDKCFNICATVVCAIFALIGIAITIAAWCMSTFFIEIRIAISIFGLGFLFTISVMLLYLIWSKK